ncbi:MAG: hypothetical protein DI537_62590 [Stutzerimonas stutzeri]|nr:MAG: hypothetical protein DI537_62590 [Stutzerimonas stutzeri]USQ74127.1 CBS domain-containing protein [Roseomonas mucosa]
MGTKTAEIMSRDVITVPPDASMAEVARLLAAHRISALPVVGPAGEVLGIVSESDLLRPFRKSHQLRRQWWLDLFAEGYDLAPTFLDYVKTEQRQARDLMTTSLVTAEEGMELAEVAELGRK